MAIPFQVLILGSGSAIPQKNKNHTSQLVIYNGKHLLVDCGEGTQIQLKKFGVGVQKIDHIFISHLHGDHYLGLPGLISSMNLLGREKKLSIYGPVELKKIIDLHFEVANSRSAFPIEFISTHDSEQELLLNLTLVKVYSFPLKHKIQTTGFLIAAGSGKRKIKKEAVEFYGVPKQLRAGIAEGRNYTNDEGKVIDNKLLTLDPEPLRTYAYCSDTVYIPELKKVLSGVNVLYHETSFMKEDQKRAKDHFHTTAEQAAILARDCSVGKLLIGHFSNKYMNQQDVVNEAKAIFPETFYAEEGVTYEI